MENTPHGALYAPRARLDQAWHDGVLLRWDAHGTLTEVRTGVDVAALDPALRAERARGPVIPGMPNLHSHAFQSAMAGLTEYRAHASDSFWSWRDLMYRFAARIEPEDMAAIAHHLYIRMLKAGYTAVCEFHYVHHQPDGSRYAQPAELALRLVDAADRAGIGMTMLPVLYQYGNFGAAAPHAGQRRFLNRPDQLLDLLRELRQARPESAQRRYGVAPHSLRAVTAESLRELLDGLERESAGAPVHIHIAEQTAEVEACQARHGARPVQWLLDHFDVDARWCLVHATHLDAREIERLADSGTTVGLCLTTEANLGDGFFPATEYLARDGRFGIGSDSHISIHWASELRLLEYGQRLQRRERNVLASPTQPYLADRLFDAAALGGARATGRAVGELRVGRQADFLVLDPDHPQLAEQSTDTLLSSLVFSEHDSSPIRDVYVAGRPRIRDGHHPDEAEALARYRETLATLLRQG